MSNYLDDILTGTGGPATQLSVTGGPPVNIGTAPPPSAGDVLRATSPTSASWQAFSPSTGGSGGLQPKPGLIGNPDPNQYAVSDGSSTIVLPATAIVGDRAGVYCIGASLITAPTGQTLFFGSPDNSVTGPDPISLPQGCYAEWILVDFSGGDFGWLPTGASNEGGGGGGSSSGLERAGDDQNPEPGEWGFVGADNVNVPDTDVEGSRFGVAVDRGQDATLHLVFEPSNTSLQLGNVVYDAGLSLKLRGGGYYEWTLADMGEGQRWIPAGMSAEQPAPLQFRRNGSGTALSNEWVASSDWGDVVNMPQQPLHGDVFGVLVDGEGGSVIPANGQTLRNPTADDSVDFPDALALNSYQFYEWLWDENQQTWVPRTQTAYIQADAVFTAIEESTNPVFYVGDTAGGTAKAIRGVSDPTLADEAATKSYVDAATAGSLALSFGGASSSVVGGANVTGVSTAVSHADHQHALVGYGTTAGTICQGSDARLSDDRRAVSLKSATTTVAIGGATAPSAGQVLTAVNSTSAQWQSVLGGGDVTTTGAVITDHLCSYDNTTGDVIEDSGIAKTDVRLVSTMGTGVNLWLNTPSSANLAACCTGETGTGALVFGTSPTIATATLTAPTLTAAVLGTPASGTLSGCQLMAVSAISANTTAAGGTVYLVDSTSAVTVTLPSAAANTGKQITVKRKTGASIVVVNTTALQTIDGAVSLSLTIPFEWVSVVSDGTAWFQIS